MLFSSILNAKNTIFNSAPSMLFYFWITITISRFNNLRLQVRTFLRSVFSCNLNAHENSLEADETSKILWSLALAVDCGYYKFVVHIFETFEERFSKVDTKFGYDETHEDDKQSSFKLLDKLSECYTH